MITVFLALVCLAAVIAPVYFFIVKKKDKLTDSLEDEVNSNNSSVDNKETMKASPVSSTEKTTLTFEEVLEKNKEWMNKQQQYVSKTVDDILKAAAIPTQIPNQYTYTEIVTKQPIVKTTKKKTKKVVKRVKKDKASEKPVVKMPAKETKKKPTTKKKTKKVESSSKS